jgi:hypothetical protein
MGAGECTPAQPHAKPRLETYVDVALRLAHLMSSAVWFGAMLVLAGDARRLKRQLIVSLLAGLVAVTTGAIVIFTRGGFTAFPRRFAVAFGLSLMALLAEVQVLAPALRSLGKDVSAQKRFVVTVRMIHAIRTAVFVLMVTRR